MSDILLSRALGTASAGRSQATVSAPASIATATGPQAGLANATVGSLITGIVVEHLGRAGIVLRTDKGLLRLQTALSPKIGARISAEVQSTGARTDVRILTIDDVPPAQQKGGRDGAGPRDPSPHVPLSSGGVASSGPRAGSSSASGIGGAAQAGPVPQSLSPSSGSTAPSAAAPASQVPSGQELHAPLRTGLIVPARVLTFATPGAAAEGPIYPFNQTVLTVRVLAIAPPGSAFLAPQVQPLENGAPPLAGRIEATSVRTSPQPGSQRETVVTVGQGRLALGAPPPGPEGTRILLEPMLSLPQGAGRESPDTSVLKSHLSRPGGEWPALREAVALLGASRSANDSALPALPRPGAQLASQLLFFLSALRSGDVRGWLGREAMDLLDRAGPPILASRLGEEFGQLSRLANTSTPGGWHSIAIPLETGDRIGMVRFHYRHQERETARDDDTGGSRFVVEADLTSTGRLQLDGLLRPRRFELMVRSGQAIEDGMQAGIHAIFTDALTAGGMSGTLSFASGDFPAFTPFDVASGTARRAEGIVI